MTKNERLDEEEEKESQLHMYHVDKEIVLLLILIQISIDNKIFYVYLARVIKHEINLFSDGKRSAATWVAYITARKRLP